MKNQGKGKKMKAILGIWLLLGIVACIFIVLNSPEENGSSVQNEQAAVRPEKMEPELPAFKKDSGLSEAEKVRNPLIMNHVGNVKVITNIRGERLGVAQKIYLSPKDFESITAKNLKDFWRECNFDGWMFVYILEDESIYGTGRGMVITTGGKTARYGILNNDESAGVEFGNFDEVIREFFYLSDENDFQYFNSDDPDDESLKRFKDSDLIFASKIKK